MVAIGKAQSPDNALPIIFGAVIVAGVLGFLLAPYFSKLVRFFPPVVTGTVITLIGVSLLPVAFNWSQGGNDRAPDYGSLTNIGMAALTFVIVLVLRRVLRGFLQQIAILLGLIAGTLIAIPVGISHFSAITEASLVGFPTPFHFGAPQFDIAAIVSMCIVMLVCMTESTADMLALGRIVDRPADERTIEGGLRADTLGTALSPLFNGFANSAFAQNIGLVAMTKVRSRYVVATSGLILIVLGLCPVAASVISLVPLCLGLIPIAAPDFYHHLPKDLLVVLDSGISTGCLVAIVLNLAFNPFGRKTADGEAAGDTTAAGPVDPGIPQQPAPGSADDAGEPAAAPAH